MNSGNQKTKIPTNDTEENLSKELVKYLEESGREKLKLEEKQMRNTYCCFLTSSIESIKEEDKDARNTFRIL